MKVARAEDLAFRELPGRRAADPFAGERGAGASVRVVTVSAGATRTPHRHPQSAEVIYVLRGRGWVWEAGTSRPVREGDWVLLERGLPHATIPDAAGSIEVLCFFPHPDLAGNIEELEGEIDRATLGGGAT